MRGDVKITFVVWLSAMLLLVAGVSAQIYMPQVINGRVEGIDVGNLPIKITNLRTGAEQFYSTSSAGEWIFDAANFDDFGKTVMRYSGGDEFRIEIEYCSELSDACVTTVRYPDDVGGEGNIFVTFDTMDILIPIPTTCPDAPSCKTLKEQLPYFCPELEELCQAEFEEKCGLIDKECPDPDALLAWLLASAVAGAIFVSGWLVKIKVGRYGEDAFSKEIEKHMTDRTGFRAWEQDGRVLFKHFHMGIVGYHSPDVVHNDPADRHPKGQLIV